MNNRASAKDAARLRILLVEDHEIVREGVRVMVGAQADMEVVGEAGDGSTALRLAQELRPDIIVMDISMPGMNGLELCQQVRVHPQASQTPILMLSAVDTDEFANDSREAGANGNIPKSEMHRRLVKEVMEYVPVASKN